MKKGVNGFTLAETLIVLVIIGIISALIIPYIYNKIQIKILKTQYLKAYSGIQNVLQKMKFDIDGEIWENYANYNKLGNKYLIEEFQNDFLQYFNDVKTDSDYFIKSYNDPAYIYGIGRFSANGGSRRFIVNNAYTVGFTINAWLIYITIDTNTSKNGPNRHGYDVFQFLIRRNSNDKLIPYDDYGAKCGTVTGKDCSYYAVNDISPYDYKKHYWDKLR